MASFKLGDTVLIRGMVQQVYHPDRGPEWESYGLLLPDGGHFVTNVGNLVLADEDSKMNSADIPRVPAPAPVPVREEDEDPRVETIIWDGEDEEEPPAEEEAPAKEEETPARRPSRSVRPKE